MLWMEWRMLVDSLRRRKRMLLCSFWFLLLFAAGGLVLFIHLQDLYEMVPQEAPGTAKATLVITGNHLIHLKGREGDAVLC
ncbi:hypothetical protein NHX12_006150 [Muraenolepis orangiensis]|uniref:Uncharacterized protein n=1 Tax=Muraenolepis orangiensis TaxID=630683 RepID=A0A9Q0IEA5_9TELE|nr:hypothetical protein NHX12_006150 [Muraenolepis orangiensis]